MSASSTEYGSRNLSASPVPLASPAIRVLSSSCDSVSGLSPVASSVAGGGGGSGVTVRGTGGASMAMLIRQPFDSAGDRFAALGSSEFDAVTQHGAGRLQRTGGELEHSRRPTARQA